MAWRSAILGVIGLCLSATAAHAEPLDAYAGLPREAGLAGADLGFADPCAAGHANPAAVVNDSHFRFSLGYAGHRHHLRINGADVGVEDQRTLLVAMNIPWRTGPVDHGLNLTLSVPEQRLVRIRILPTPEPRFEVFDNGVQRLDAWLVYGLRWRWIALGAGVGVFADAIGDGIRFAIEQAPGQTALATADVDLRLKLKLYPLLGLNVEPVAGLRFSFTWRGSVDLGIRLGTVATLNVDPGFSPLTGTAGVGVRGTNYFTPERFGFGAAWQGKVADGVTLLVAAAVHWYRWSRHPGVVPTIDLDLALKLGADPFVIDVARRSFDEARFRDTVSPAFGMEITGELGPVDLAGRFGYAYRPTPAPPQTGVLNVLDNHRHLLSAGLSVMIPALAEWTGAAPSIDFFAQFQYLEPRRHEKTALDSPVPSFRADGFVWGGGVQMVLRF